MLNTWSFYTSVPIGSVMCNNVSHSLAPKSIGQVGCSSTFITPAGIRAVEVRLQATASGRSELSLASISTSSKHSSGIAGNLVQTVFKQPDSIVHVEVSVAEVMCT